MSVHLDDPGVADLGDVQVQSSGFIRTEQPRSSVASPSSQALSMTAPDGQTAQVSGSERNVWTYPGGRYSPVVYYYGTLDTEPEWLALTATYDTALTKWNYVPGGTIPLYIYKQSTRTLVCTHSLKHLRITTVAVVDYTDYVATTTTVTEGLYRETAPGEWTRVGPSSAAVIGQYGFQITVPYNWNPAYLEVTSPNGGVQTRTGFQAFGPGAGTTCTLNVHLSTIPYDASTVTVTYTYKDRHPFALQNRLGQFHTAHSNAGQLVYRRSDYAQPPFAVDVTVRAGTRPRMAEDADMRLHMVYEAGGSIYLSVSDDDGETWGAGVAEFTGGTYPTLAVQPLSGALVTAAIVSGAIKGRWRAQPNETPEAFSFLSDTGAAMLTADAFHFTPAPDGRWLLVVRITGESDVSYWDSGDDCRTWSRIT